VSEPPRPLGTGNELLDRLIELSQGVVSRAETLVRDVNPAAAAWLGYRSAYKATLLQVIEELEEVAATAGALDPYLSHAHAESAASRVRAVLDVWGRLNAAIDAAVVKVVRGEADRGFQLLSPIANSHNLRGRRRLTQLFEGLDELARRMAPAPAAAEQPPDAAQEEAGPEQLLRKSVDPLESGLDLDDEEEVSILLEAIHTQPEEEELNYTDVFEEPSHEVESQTPFLECLARLDGFHEIDRNDALVELLRRHQHQLVAHLIRGAAQQDPMLEHLLDTLWRNAEIVLLDDYFFSSRRSKLTSFIELADPYPVANRFRRLLRLFKPGPTGYPGAADALAIVETDDPDHYRVYLKALVVHPLEEYRRHAAAQLDPTDFWTIVTFPQAPLPALVTIVEQLGHPDVSDDQRKVFFDCTLRTLAAARGQEPIKAVRRILNTLFTFDFFVEDEYFRKIISLNQLVEHQEALAGRPSAHFHQSIQLLKEQKRRVGEKPARSPSFDRIPLTVQRMLAREGLYTQLFARHPDAKIALETLRFLNSPDRAAQALKFPNINTMLLSELAKRDHLFRTRAARMALISNPHTPLRAVYGYVPLMNGEDLRRLATSRDVNPEITEYLTRLLQRKGVKVR